MAEQDDHSDVDDLLEEHVDEIPSYPQMCDECLVIDESVKLQPRSRRQKTADDDQVDVYLCVSCAKKRHEEAQKVMQDLEHLAREVEQRLQAIENTERELDEWRDAQLQKNRDFWDEYRRQVENFSACRIRTLQYEYTMRELKTQRIMKRLKRAKYIAEHIEQLRGDLHNLLEPSLIELLCSEKLKAHFSLCSSTTEDDSNLTTAETRRELFEQLEQLSCLDAVTVPGDDQQQDDSDPLKDE